MDDPFLSDHPLRGPLLKMTRARQHFDQLRSQCDDFMADEPYDWRTEYEDLADDRRRYTVYAETTADPDPEWGLIAGDVIQNVRSALDQLIWGISDDTFRNNRTAFPIYDDESRYRKNALQQIAGVTELGRRQIESWQPFRWTSRVRDHPLAILQELSNIDKHRTLLPIAVARRNEHVAGFGEFRVDEFIDHRPGLPIGDEDRAFSFVTSGEPRDEVKANAYMTFEMTIEGRPIRALESILVYVGTDIIGWFERG